MNFPTLVPFIVFNVILILASIFFIYNILKRTRKILRAAHFYFLISLIIFELVQVLAIINYTTALYDLRLLIATLTSTAVLLLFLGFRRMHHCIQEVYYLTNLKHTKRPLKSKK